MNWSCNTRKKAGSRDLILSGKVTFTTPYCGGARPSDEMLQEYNRPKPYAGKVLFAERLGPLVVPPVRIVTNDTGYFSVSLSPGDYVLLQEEQLDTLNVAELKKPGMVEVDTVCLKKWKHTPLASVSLRQQNIDSITINFPHPCFISGDIPCRHYVGPMPP